MNRLILAMVALLAASSFVYSQIKPLKLNVAENLHDDTIGSPINQTSAISIESQNAKAIHMLGTWHRTFGILTISLSALSVIGGILIIANNQQTVEGIVYLAGGCIDMSIGIWEVNIGSNLKKFK